MKRALRAVAVLREPVFSPGMVERDAEILRSAAALVEADGVACPVIGADELEGTSSVPHLVLSMAEGEGSLDALEKLERAGSLVVNAPSAVRATRRAALLELARPRGPLVEGVLVATDDGHRVPGPLLANGSVWVKRGDFHALGQGDVVRVPSDEVVHALRDLLARGVRTAVVQPHLEGCVVKFYGVLPSFFRTFPLSPSTHASSAEGLAWLSDAAFSAARAAGLEVFGGDAVFPADGGVPAIIDLNAWPSFWRCRSEAAAAIARRALAAARGRQETARR